MIAHLRGTGAGGAPDGAVIEVGGVGMRVQCTPGTLATLTLGEPAQVATSLVVREDSLTLYGFGSDDERNVFELLQTASGVGPRLALAMLAVHAPDALPQRAAQWRDQVQSGLVNLGWAARDADQAIAALEEDGTINAANGEAVDVALVLPAALRK